MPPRLIVLGWDSATFDVIDPLVASGRLPVLASLQERGFRAGLRSTWPPMTDCAWTSAFTGRNPGGHGIFGSWYRAPGAYACRYFSSRDRKAPALWEMAGDVRFVAWNIPMAFPPTSTLGAMVSGYGAPPGAKFCEPAGLQDELASRWPLDDLLDRAPHGSLEEFLDDLIRGLEAQAEALPWITTETGADCLVAVWPQVDRAQHFFWRFRDTDHPFADAVDRVYEAMDRATGAVVGAFPDADVLVVSDHGAGTLKGDVNLGAWLNRNGHARYGRTKRSPLVELAWKMPPSLRRLGRRMAPGLARSAMATTLTGQLGPFDWANTDAFLGFHSDVWVNLKGREPQGTIAPEDASGFLEELRDGLLGIEDPSTGAPVFAGAHLRDEVYSGPHAAMAPDLILDSWGAGYRVSPNRTGTDAVVIQPSALSGVDEAWSSDHRPVGIFVGAGPNLAHGSTPELSLYDVCPTALALLGKEIPEGLDGRAAEIAISRSFLESNPVTIGGPAGERSLESSYSDDEAAAVAEHLKDLGYIE